MKYLANDGKVFDDECACMEYEHKLEAELNKKVEALERINALKDDYLRAKDEYLTALQKYQKEYCDDEEVCGICNSDILEHFARRFFVGL